MDFFPCLVAVTKNSKNMLNKSGESRHLALVLISEGILLLFTIEYYVSCGFLVYNLYYIEVCSLYPCFLENFYHK